MYHAFVTDSPVIFYYFVKRSFEEKRTLFAYFVYTTVCVLLITVIKMFPIKITIHYSSNQAK